MKTYKFFISALLLGLTSCSESFIDIAPQSYVTEAVFFSNAAELNIALNACYAGMRRPAAEEWKFTELRSDNAVMNQIATTAPDNLIFFSYDGFFIDNNDIALSNYWYFSYVNIKNNNILLDKMNVNYNGSAIVYGANSINATAAEIKEIASQATFLRAYHYFNLVRLFGDVMLVHEPISGGFGLNRVDKSKIYELIIADLLNTIANGNSTKYASITASSSGKVNTWAAKALLAKVYLTLGRKSDALPILKDIIANSGFDLESTYARVFSTTNELNKEILFTIRYKSGNLGLGSPFTSDFAPASTTGGVVVTGNQGDNSASQELYDSFNSSDIRRTFVAESADISVPKKLFFSKFHVAQTVRNDSEFDFPIIRYSDVLLMYAEAAGALDPNTLPYINRVRTRAGLSASQLVAASIDTPAKFDLAVANERRWEFTAENHRWFDLLRYNTTLPTLNAVNIMKNHFTIMHPLLYSFYTQNVESATLPILLERVGGPNKLLLPIPLKEIELNNNIIQN